MGPGQRELNDFELAILRRIAANHPSLTLQLDEILVLNRTFTGAGSYTEFFSDSKSERNTKQHFGLDALIQMPGVDNGMGADLLCLDGRPKCLEIFTYGGDRWDGWNDGFSIDGVALDR